MYLESFSGNNSIKTALKKAVGERTLAHGVLLMGEKGTGVNHFSHLLAADIVGADSIRQIDENRHPSVQIIKGEGKSGQISVKSVREINDNVNFSSVTGDRRVIIIENCENFNNSSANALLKNLEEPKDDITYILTTNNPRTILATIRSRCAVYTLSTPSRRETMRYFDAKHADSNAVKQLMRVYGTNIGKTERRLGDKKRMDILGTATEIVNAASAKDSYEIARLLYSYVKDKESVRLCLEDINDISSSQLSTKSIKMMETVQRYREILRTNVNLNLAIENFAVECVK